MYNEAAKKLSAIVNQEAIDEATDSSIEGSENVRKVEIKKFIHKAKARKHV